MNSAREPKLRLVDRQRKRRLPLIKLRSFAAWALREVCRLSKLLSLPEEIIVIFVSDSRIAKIHRDFMDIQGPTDVITFQHGDIFISVETAERQAPAFDHSFDEELQVYLLHGLLHLAGFDDRTESGFAEMTRVQEDLIRLFNQGRPA